MKGDAVTETFADGTVRLEETEGVATITLDRLRKRNAVDPALLGGLEAAFDVAGKARAVVLRGAGDHFCAGLDLGVHIDRDAVGVMAHSRRWHRFLEGVQFGPRPVIAALRGAVVGGGLEIAAACHVRVADGTAFFSLPEARRGIFVGGGGSVRLARIVGPDRLIEMMLTGRRVAAEEARAMGLAHRLTDGDAYEAAYEVARQIAGNAPLVNEMILQAVPRAAEAPAALGYLTESMAAALTQTTPEAREGLAAFLEKRDAVFR